MPRYLTYLVVFLAGLAAVGWIGAGYAVSNPFALLVTILIGGGYVTGALELKRFRDVTSSLERAVMGLSGQPPGLRDWLEQVHPSLRNAVRLRIEGERVAMPGPALTPYLIGLLVLLGMLGTLLGMVVTLRGTGAALESATDFEAIRASLAAPIKGLGFAFGTSIAGVATSAMLGLLSALCRRERGDAAQLLDVKIATTWRAHSPSHQREETLELLRRQAAVMPALVDGLQAMMASIEQRSATSSERQIASQDAFHRNAEAAYLRLASSVDQSLRLSVAESARAAGAALQPVVEATMAGLARETAALHDTVTHAVQRQMEGFATGFEASTAVVSTLWSQALAEHRQASDALTQRLGESLAHFTETFEQRSSGLLEGVSLRMETAAARESEAWDHALSRQERVNDQLTERNRQAMDTAAASFAQHLASLSRTMDESQSQLRAQSASEDRQRLAVWTETLGAMAATLSKEWEQAGARSASRQQEICETLHRTVRDISAQTQAHASETIAEISRLVQAASEAPRAAAEVVVELREKLSESMVRDTAMLEERSRLLQTLETLLDAINHACTEQRLAVDALVATSANVLDRVGGKFSDQVEAETEKLGVAAAQVSGSAVEVASLGEAFGVAVQLFGESNDKLVAHLQRIEAALDKSLARSDEQLAYYVAQAREVIDLSMMSQKRIVEDLQQIAGQRASAGAESA